MSKFFARGVVLLFVIQLFPVSALQTVYAQTILTAPTSQTTDVKSQTVFSTEAIQIAPEKLTTTTLSETTSIAPLTTVDPLDSIKPSEGTDTSTSPQPDLSGGLLEPKTPEIPEIPQFPETDTPENLLPIVGEITEPIQQRERVETKTDKGNLDINKTNGSASYNYALSLPAGRNGMTPSLSLNYDSSNKSNDSIIGQGWTLSQYSITRTSRYGVDKIYTQNEFTSSLPMANDELLSVSLTDDKHGIYGAKVEQAFLKYEFMNNDTWKVTDKYGTKYFFGLTAASRQDDPNDPNRIYKWMLDEIRDTNGNWIKYTYFKDSGEIYPRSINYTGHENDAGITTVKFEPFYSVPQEIRPDYITNYLRGFPVTTKNILNFIEIEISGQNNGRPVVRYDFEHTKSNSNNRQMLTSITEVGINAGGIESPLPSTDFTYSDEGNTNWVQQTVNWQGECTLGYHPWTGYDTPTDSRLIDINADGLTDCAQPTNGGNKINTGTDLIAGLPAGTMPPQMYGNYPSTAMLELNGDGRIDFVKSLLNLNSNSEDKEFFIHDGNYSWTRINGWNTPTPMFVDHSIRQPGTKTGDFNGDGLTDIIQLRKDFRSIQEHYADIPTVTINYSQHIWLNNGINGWDEDTDWEFTDNMQFVENRFNKYPSYSEEQSSFWDSIITDYNQDGLADLLFAPTYGGPSSGIVYLNNGNKGWIQISNNITGRMHVSGRDYGFRMVDINADGMNDTFNAIDVGQLFNVSGYQSANTNWTNKYPDENVPISDGNGRYKGSEITDLDGNGTMDIIRGYFQVTSGDDPRFYFTYLNQASVPDLLVNINNNRGSEIDIEYKNSPQYRDANNALENPKLHIPKLTVNKITYSDPYSPDYEVNYNYEDGQYIYTDSHHNDFGGFNVITKTDNLGMVEKTFYHQGGAIDGSTNGEFSDHISKIGKPYRTEVYKNNNGQLQKYSQSIMKWESFDLGNGRFFPKMTQELNFAFDGTTASKDTAKITTYNNTNGNVIEETMYGEVDAVENGTYTDIGNDTIRTAFTYAASPNINVTGLPSSKTTYNSSNTKLQAAQYYYDNLTIGQVSLGNKTLEKQWLTGTTYYTTQYFVDTYGNITKVIDPKGNQTNYNYGFSGMYPSTINNALGHTYTYTYNYLNGQPITISGPNNDQTTNTFDTHGRLIQTNISDPLSPATQRKVKEISYVENVIPNYTQVTLYKINNDTTPNISRTYTNGSGKTIQTRSLSETANTYTVSDLTYDAKGQLTRQSLPYFSTGTAYTQPDLTKQANNFTYDILGRILTTSNILGTSSIQYDKWKTVTTDPLNHAKWLINDAYGRLTEVHEFNQGKEYITKYTYTLLGNLQTITNQLGQIRNFTYDNLGRLISQNDFHIPTDTTFSSWNYTYDENSNLLSKSPAFKTYIFYEYDALNRPTFEKSQGPDNIKHTKITYTYDTAPYGKGRLKSVVKDGYSANYEYDIQGNVKKETAIIQGKTFTTYWYHNLLNKVVNQTNPDSNLIHFTYNAANQIDTVLVNNIAVITQIDYTPMGQISRIQYANNTITVNEYPENQMYRLTRIQTSLNGNVIQHLLYQYDAINNVTQISDVSSNVTKKIATYTYDDLSRLLTAHAENNGQIVFDESYIYNEVGNILSKSDIGTYAYDGAEKLTTAATYANPHATTQAGTIKYEYDKIGNVSKIGTKELNSNYKQEMDVLKNGSSGVLFSYDQNGNRVWKKSVTFGTILTPPPGLPVNTCTPQVGADPLCRPITNWTKQNRYINDSYEEEENKIGGLIKRSHILVNGKQLATITSNKPNILTPATIKKSYHHSDHLGSASLDTDANGAILTLADYLPFGKTLNEVNNATDGTTNDYKFTGQELDEETGLYYYNARYYDQNIGRFLAMDKVEWALGMPGELKNISGKQIKEVLTEPQTLNGYSYVLNNPLKYTDSTGNVAVLALPAGAAFGQFLVDSITIVVGASIIANNHQNNGTQSLSTTTNDTPYTDNRNNEAKDTNVRPTIENKATTEKAESPTTMYNVDRKMPNDGCKPIPDVEVPHTQITTKDEGKWYQPYRQTREWGWEGEIVKDIDWTDHGRPNEHSNPHEHIYQDNSTGGCKERPKKGQPLTQ